MKTIEQRAARWLNTHSVNVTRAALGLVFVWFGLLKFCPGLCDVEQIAQKTLVLLTFGLIPAPLCTALLGIWETAMGLTLLLAQSSTPWGRSALRLCSVLLLLHLAGTFLPLALFPADTWKHIAVAPTLAGQYILKNVVLMSGALSIGASTLSTQRKPAIQPAVARPQLVRRSAEDRSDNDNLESNLPCGIQ